MRDVLLSTSPCSLNVKYENVIRMGYRRDIFINGIGIVSGSLQVKCIRAQSVPFEHYDIIIGLKNSHLNKLLSMGKKAEEKKRSGFSKIPKYFHSFSSSFTFLRAPISVRLSFYECQIFEIIKFSTRNSQTSIESTKNIFPVISTRRFKCQTAVK